MKNTVIQGDCLEVMDKLIERGIIFDAIICDPPYGTTACKWDSVIPFAPMWERLNKLIKSNGAIVLFGSEPFSSALRMSNIKNYKYDWVWNKVTPTAHTVAKLRPMQLNELISVFSDGTCANGSKRNMRYNPQGLIPYGKIVNKQREEKANEQNQYRRENHKAKYLQEWTNYPKTILKFSKPSSRDSVHPTQKPVALMEYLIKTYTNEGDLVLDFTAGSGTTGVACRNTGRDFIMIEKEQKYVDICNERLQQEVLFK